jgi:Uma2 family endonuclease
MTTLQQPAIEEVLAELAQEKPHIYLPGVGWDFYEAVVRAVGARPSLRITFDRGDMELMTISGTHDSYKHLLGLFFVILAEELGVDFKGCGSCTLKGADLEHGLEADEWFYTCHESQVRFKRDIDLRVDPPPDVAIEIEISRNVVLSRQDVYAAMRVPELWLFDGQVLTSHLLGADGKYHGVARSPTFPNVPLEELVRFVEMSTTMGERALLGAFRTWVREHILPTWQAPQES